MRTIKILELLIETVKRFIPTEKNSFGLCYFLLLLYHEDKITYKERLSFIEALDLRTRDFSTFWTFEGEEIKTRLFLWHPMDYQSRIDFLEAWIKELEKN